MVMELQKEVQPSSTIDVPEVINFAGIGFSMYAHVCVDLLKVLFIQRGLIFSAFPDFLESCGNSVLLRSLLYCNLSRH